MKLYQLFETFSTLIFRVYFGMVDTVQSGLRVKVRLPSLLRLHSAVFVAQNQTKSGYQAHSGNCRLLLPAPSGSRRRKPRATERLFVSRPRVLKPPRRVSTNYSVV